MPPQNRTALHCSVFFPPAYLSYLTVTARELRSIPKPFSSSLCESRKELKALEYMLRDSLSAPSDLLKSRLNCLHCTLSLHACQGRNPHKPCKKSLYSCSGNVHFSASAIPCRHDIGEADPPSALNTEMSQVKTYLEEPLSQTDINWDLDCLRDHGLNLYRSKALPTQKMFLPLQN